MINPKRSKDIQEVLAKNGLSQSGIVTEIIIHKNCG